MNLSKLIIINLALDALGQDAINQDELTARDDDNARVCDDNYDLVRVSLLELYPYDFASDDFVLTVSGSTMNGFEYCYDKPDEALSVYGIWNPVSKKVDDKIRFKTRRGLVGTDQEDAVAICCLDEDDPTAYSASFARGFALHLAAAVCKAVTGKDSLKRDLLQEAGHYIRLAQTNTALQEYEDAQETTGRRYIDL